MSKPTIGLIGLGLHDGGTGVVRFRVREGADVTVTDRRSAAALDPAIRALDGLPVTYRLGGHEGIQVREYDLVVRNPAIPTDAPLLMDARAAGIPVEMEMTLFLAACPAPVIGVTGTKGKTTTTHLRGWVVERGGMPCAIVGTVGGADRDRQWPRTNPTPLAVDLHQLLAALIEGEGIADDVLADLDADLEKVRGEIERLRHESGLEEESREAQKKPSKTPLLDQFCRDLTELAQKKGTTASRPDPAAAEEFYATAFGLGDRLLVHAADAPTSGFRGYILSLVVAQPNIVDTLIDAATHGGATTLKSAQILLLVSPDSLR